MTRMLMTLVGLGFATLVAAADDKPKPPDTSAAKLAALQKEAKAAEAEFSKKLQGLSEGNESEEKMKAIFKEHWGSVKRRMEAALEVGKADPVSDVAFEAFGWVVTQYAEGAQAVQDAATELLAKHHAGNAKIGPVVLTVGQFAMYSPAGEGKATAGLLTAVAEKNPDKTIRGQVAMVRAWQAKAKYDAAEADKDKKAEELATVAEKAFEVVIKDFGDCKLQSTFQKVSQTLAEAAKPELFELRNLRVGKPAPDIEGEDLDGAKFKLSDYKGKVVMLDFWGDW